MNIQNQKLDARSAGAKVTYIPAHALGDAEHPDIEEGTISSWNNEFVFVDYGMGKGQATYPNDLVWNHVVGVNKMAAPKPQSLPDRAIRMPEALQALHRKSNQVKKLQDYKRHAEAEMLTMAQTHDELRSALEKYRGQTDNEGNLSATDALENTKRYWETPTFHERLEKWSENTRPNPSADRLRGTG